MSQEFFERPILNSPYDYPSRHWKLETDGQPTNQIEPTQAEIAARETGGH